MLPLGWLFAGASYDTVDLAEKFEDMEMEAEYPGWNDIDWDNITVDDIVQAVGNACNTVGFDTSIIAEKVVK